MTARILFVVVLAGVPLVAAPLSDADRTALVQDLERSQQLFLTSIADVKTEAQMVLMLSGHTERHTAQLLEVKASPGYPK